MEQIKQRVNSFFSLHPNNVQIGNLAILFNDINAMFAKIKELETKLEELKKDENSKKS